MEENILRESAKEYIEIYQIRLKEFLIEYEGDEQDFIEKEIDYFLAKLNELKKPYISFDYNTIVGGQNKLSGPHLIVKEIGLEKFYYSTKRKIRYLESRKALLPQQMELNNNLTRNSLLNELNKLIPNVTISEVLNHFEVLTKTTNRDDEFYLTPKQLLTFVKSTFIDLTPIKQNFNCNFSKDKIDVRSVFRKFQNMCSLREKNNKYLKQKYYGILDNSFTGFNQTDFDKWHVTNNKIPTNEKLKSK